MYERNAVILEKYFSEKFYYKDRSNLKNNFENYQILIDILEKYQDVSEAEDKIIKECEEIADQIKQIQKNQSNVYRKTLKMQQDRNSLFENIDESAIELGKQLDKIERSIDKYNARMRPIDQEFIDTIAKFNEKSDIRSECGKKRRKIEKEYRTVLERTKNILNEIEAEKLMQIKNYIASDNKEHNEELKSIINKNGEKEKIPFDSNVVENAILFGQAIYKKEANILIDIYDQTNSVVNDINNNTVKISKYKKSAKDSKNLLSFINIQKEYLVQFLDNERLAVGLGKQEHSRLMKDACVDFAKDTVQISNLNELLLGEIAGKANFRMYNELYCAEYLVNLKVKEREFERKLSKLNLVGQILNPIYWRIVSIEKMYSVFDDIVEKEYDRDLSNYKINYEEETEPEEEEEDIIENIDLLQEPEEIEPEYEEIEAPVEIIQEEEPKKAKGKIGRKPKKEKKEKPEVEEETNEIDMSKLDIEDDNDIMSYYDNLDSEVEDTKNREEVRKVEIDEDEDDDDDEDSYEGIYPSYRQEFEEEEEDEMPSYDSIFQSNYNEESSSSSSIFYNGDDDDDDFYDDDDDLYDEDDDEVYEDIETILKNRRKRLNKNRKMKANKKKGFFGFGGKK